jgi:hypothetical protein
MKMRKYVPLKCLSTTWHCIYENSTFSNYGCENLNLKEFKSTLWQQNTEVLTSTTSVMIPRPLHAPLSHTSDFLSLNNTYVPITLISKCAIVIRIHPTLSLTAHFLKYCTLFLVTKTVPCVSSSLIQCVWKVAVHL